MISYPMRKQNVILIMADDFGYECIEANGGRSYSTPNFNRMAENGVRFSHCFGQPLCTPSRVQIMTGKYNDKNYEGFGYLPIGERTFGNLFQEQGYHTCITGKWQLNNIGKDEAGRKDRKRFQKFGFDESCMWQMTETRQAGERYANPLIDTNGEDLRVHEDAYGPDIFCNYGLDFIERHQNEPFFWYYPMVLTHDPFFMTPHSKEWATGDREAERLEYFRDMVEYTDHLIGRIIRIYDIEADLFEKEPLPDDDPVVANIRSQYEPVFNSRPSWEDCLKRMESPA